MQVNCSRTDRVVTLTLTQTYHYIGPENTINVDVLSLWIDLLYEDVSQITTDGKINEFGLTHLTSLAPIMQLDPGLVTFHWTFEQITFADVVTAKAFCRWVRQLIEI